MLTGKQFKIQNPTLAFDALDGKRRAVTIPTGGIIKIVSGPNGDGDRMVDVLWEGRVVTMFVTMLTCAG